MVSVNECEEILLDGTTNVLYDKVLIENIMENPGFKR